jgi:hypothetical protein
VMRKAMVNNNQHPEIAQLAAYVQGFADSTENAELSKASEWLRKLSYHVCVGDMVGCEGGQDCTSDHK